jgi:hypothetical protein
MVLKSVIAVALLALAPQADAGLCTRYQALAVGDEKVVPRGDVTRWAEYALRAEGLYDEKVPCFLTVSVMSMRTQNKAGRETGWVVALHISIRRFEGPDRILIGDENNYLFTDSDAASLKPTIREDIERFISGLKQVRPSSD